MRIQLKKQTATPEPPPSKTVLILTALWMEQEAIRRRLKINTSIPAGNLKLLQSRRKNILFILGVTGVGSLRAAEVFDTIVAGFKPDLLLIAGLAGALDPAVKIGTVVLPNAVMDAEQQSAPIPLNSFLDSEMIPCLYGVRLVRGHLLTVNQIVTSPTEKADLFRRTGAVAIDMESASLANRAHSAGIPCAIIRAISDGSAETLPSDLLSCTDEFGRPKGWLLARWILTHPAGMPELLRLNRNSRLAAGILAASIENYLTNLIACQSKREN
ncbi:MAG: hypothetical protein M1330_01635 [Armatimonadetes bacterium]|nr:hypothetical protein [Armatimonadota bacterium]